jgi:hypothetical protein
MAVEFLSVQRLVAIDWLEILTNQSRSARIKWLLGGCHVYELAGQGS